MPPPPEDMPDGELHAFVSHLQGATAQISVALCELQAAIGEPESVQQWHRLQLSIALASAARTFRGTATALQSGVEAASALPPAAPPPGVGASASTGAPIATRIGTEVRIGNAGLGEQRHVEEAGSRLSNEIVEASVAVSSGVEAWPDLTTLREGEHLGRQDEASASEPLQQADQPSAAAAMAALDRGGGSGEGISSYVGQIQPMPPESVSTPNLDVLEVFQAGALYRPSSSSSDEQLIAAQGDDVFGF